MTLTEELIQEIDKLVSQIRTLGGDFQAEDTLYAQNTAALHSHANSRINQQQADARAKLQDFQHRRDESCRKFQEEINKIQRTETRLQSIYPRAQLPPFAVSRPSGQYNEADAQILIAEISKHGFWAWLKRLLSGGAWKAQAADLYLRIDNAIGYFEQQKRNTDAAYRSSCAQMQANSARMVQQINANLRQSLDREEQRHRASLAALNRRKQALTANSVLHTMQGKLNAAQIQNGPAGWQTYQPASKPPTELLIGRILYPCALDKPTALQMELLRAIPSYLEAKNGFALPYTRSAARPTLLYCDLDTDTAPAAEIFRDFVVRQVRFMPPKSFHADFTDPVNRGRALGSLIHLTQSNGGCGVCGYCLGTQDIGKMMERLTKHVDTVCRKLTSVGCRDINAFNQTAAAKGGRIPYTTVVIHDFPTGFDSQSLEALRVLITQSGQCGISILISHKLSDKLEGSAAKLLQTFLSRFTTLRCQGSSYTLTHSGVSVRFLPVEAPVSAAFLQEVNRLYSYRAPLDNRLESLVALNPTPRSAVSGLDLPFAIDARGQLQELSFGYDLSAYGFISGGVGSGKTTLLHTLITSAVLHYTPQELELWLIDYKLEEFSFYLNCCPPQVRYIVTDKSPEISYSVIDYIQAEIDQRARLFQQSGAASYKDYRQRRALPKVLVVIDEFHRMSQAAEADTEYKTKLENIFREARSHGVILLLCDQFLSGGLRGLSNEAKNLISMRIAMRNDPAEIRETLRIPGGEEDDRLKKLITDTASGQEGTLLYRREVSADASHFSNRVVFDGCRGIYASAQTRQRAMEAAQRRFGSAAHPHDFCAGAQRYSFSKADVQAFERVEPLRPGEGARFYIGSPLGMGRCFYLNLENSANEDLLFVGNHPDMQFSILRSLLACAVRLSYKIVILIPRTAPLYKLHRACFDAIPGAEIYTSFPDICRFIGLRANIIREQFSGEDFFDPDSDTIGDPSIVFCINAAEIYGMMDSSSYTQAQAWAPLEQPAQSQDPQTVPVASARAPRTMPQTPTRSRRTEAPAPAPDGTAVSGTPGGLDDIEQMIFSRLSALDDDDVSPEPSGGEEEIRQIPPRFASPGGPPAFTGYNATADWGLLAANGYKLNLHTFLILDRGMSLRQMKTIKVDGGFNHRIALPMSPSEASEFMPQTRVMKSLNDSGSDDCAVYSKKGGREQCFRPYTHPAD